MKCKKWRKISLRYYFRRKKYFPKGGNGKKKLCVSKKEKKSVFFFVQSMMDSEEYFFFLFFIFSNQPLWFSIWKIFWRLRKKQTLFTYSGKENFVWQTKRGNRVKTSPKKQFWFFFFFDLQKGKQIRKRNYFPNRGSCFYFYKS